jgi:hypothetical protein
MQKAREQKRQAALNEAQDLYAYAAAHGEPWSAEAEAKANDGFVFSPSFLEDAIRRRTRLQATRLAESGLFTQNANRPTQGLSARIRSLARPAA